MAETMRPGTLYYQDEEGDETTSYGWFTGEIDIWGKHTFQESNELDAGRVLYIFPAEIIEFLNGS